MVKFDKCWPLIVVLALAVPAQANAPALSAGLWKVTRTANGGPESGKSNITKKCYSAQTLRSSPGAPFLDRPDGGRSTDCKHNGLSIKNGKIAYSTTCSGLMGTMTMKSRGTYSVDRFSISTTVDTPMGAINLQAKGTLLSKC
jgi:hypothetical protein